MGHDIVSGLMDVTDGAGEPFARDNSVAAGVRQFDGHFDRCVCHNPPILNRVDDFVLCDPSAVVRDQKCQQRKGARLDRDVLSVSQQQPMGKVQSGSAYSMITTDRGKHHENLKFPSSKVHSNVRDLTHIPLCLSPEPIFSFVVSIRSKRQPTAGK